MRTGLKDRLTARLLRCIELMVEHKDWPLCKVAEELGVHYNTVYAWNRLKLFIEKLDEELHRVFKGGVRSALNRVLDIVLTGRDADALNAARFILENSGYREAEQLELSSNNFDIHITKND